MEFNVAERLFKMNRGKSIRLTKTDVDDARTVGSSCKLSSGKTVKFNAIGLVLDKIFIDKSVMGYEQERMEMGLSIYTGDGNVQEALYGSTSISMKEILDSEANLEILIPVTIVSISLNFRIKQLFLKIAELVKESQNGEFEEGLPEAVAEFCDCVYTYIKMNNMETVEVTDGLNTKSIKTSIEKGYLKPIPGFENLAPADPNEKSDDSEKEKPVDYSKDFRIGFNGWSDDQKRSIPENELKSYVMTPEAVSIAKKIKFRMDLVNERLKNGKSGIDAIGKDYINLLLVGEPGTGKTKMSYAIAEMTGMPIYTIPISKNTEEDTFEGKNKVISGQISFAETDFIKAYEHGGIIVLEEINLADPAVIMGALGQAIEFPFVVMKDGYIPVRRHPLCVIIATMNTGTNGSKGLNQALSSRFKQSYILADPDKRLFVNILKTRNPSAKTCRWVADSYRKIKDYLASAEINREDLSSNISMRACFGVLENIEEGEDKKTAIRNTIIGKIAETDLEIAKKTDQMVVSSLPD